MSQSQTRAVLLRAAELIATKGWTQRADARTADGETCKPLDPAAVAFCLGGAITAAQPEPVSKDWPAEAAARSAVLPFFGGSSRIRWNDAPERTQAEVVAVLRRAAEMCEEET